MYKVTLFISLIFMLFTPLAAIAQNDDLAGCTATQVNAALIVIQDADFPDDYAELAPELQTLDIEGGQLLELVQDASDLQKTWWDDIVPEFPECSGTQALALVGGRVMDELIITLATSQLAYTEISKTGANEGEELQSVYEYHLANWRAFQDDFIELVAELGSAE